MSVQLSAEVQAKLDKLTAETGRAQDDLVQEAVVAYFDDLVKVRVMLDSRYDDIKAARVKLLPGDEVVARLHARSAARRCLDK